MRTSPTLNFRTLLFFIRVLIIALPSTASPDLEHLARLQELEAKWGADVSHSPTHFCIGCVTSVKAL